MTQVKDWLMSGDVQKLVVVVAGIDSGETLERWQFNVSVDTNELIVGNDENDPMNVPTSTSSGKPLKKSVKEIHNEIQAIIRQITASVSRNVILPVIKSSSSNLYSFIPLNDRSLFSHF